MRHEAVGTTLDPPRGWLGGLKYLGPGFILSAAIVGSGELIATTTLGAKAGYALLWVILFSCVIKVAIQIEFGRHCILHGRATFDAWQATWGTRFFGLHWSLWMAGLYLIALLFGQAGVMGGAALVTRYVAPEMPIAWAALGLAALTALLVSHGRYRPIEIGSMAFNLIFLLVLFYCLITVQATPMAIKGADLLNGFRSGLDRTLLPHAIGVFGITGVAAGEIAAYPYWCMEKGYAAWAGPREESPAWQRRARGWIRVMMLDAAVSLVVYTSSTLAFYLLGAAVLGGGESVKDGNQLIFQLSAIFAETAGEGSRAIFMIGAFAVLYSTVFANTAAHSRFWADLLVLIRGGREGPAFRRRVIAIGACALPLIWACLFILIKKALFLVILMGIANALFLFVVAWQGLVFRFRYTEPAFRPSRVYDGFLMLSVVAIAWMGIQSLAVLFG